MGSEKWQVYDPGTEMVHDVHFFCLNVNDSYNHKMNFVDLSDPLRNVCRVDHWMCKYKGWWSLIFWGHVLVLVNAYIIYKTLCEQGKMKPMSHYQFQCLVCLANIDPTNFGGRNHLVSVVHYQGIIKKDESTPTINILEWKKE